MDTPVAFIIFNRPPETMRSFAAIRAARPKRLFVIADGPRTEAERALTNTTRAIVDEGVDWPCEVTKYYSDVNLGCGMRPASGITAVFTAVERAIILEDDCVPDPTFFPYAEELLERYAEDERVMHIAAASFEAGNPRFHIRESYYASFIPNAFGCWATWRRAWAHYDYDLTEWPRLRDSQALIPLFKNRGGYERFARVWDNYYDKKVADSWDGQWAFACMSRGAFCLTPKVNLVRNIGFNERGTHTKTANIVAEMPVVAMPFPLIHPLELEFNRSADDYMYRFYFGVDAKLRYRFVRPLKNLFPGFYALARSLFKAT